MQTSGDQEVDDSYENFIAEAIETGCVWGLEGTEGWALCPSEINEELDVMPFWSSPEKAQVHCQEEWKEYKPVPVSLEEFLDDWLPGLHADVVLVGVDWDQDMEGDEVEPLDLLEDFDNIIAEVVPS